MRNDTKKNNLILASLLIGIVLIGIGYAALAANLDITGTASTGGASWDVKFKSIRSGTIIGDVTHTESINGLTATIDVTLPAPGTSISYKLEVENVGSIDAMYSNFTPNLDTINNSKPTQIKWNIEKDNSNNILNKENGIHTFTITISWPDDETNLPIGDTSDPIEKTGKITLNYVQKTS